MSSYLPSFSSAPHKESSSRDTCRDDAGLLTKFVTKNFVKKSKTDPFAELDAELYAKLNLRNLCRSCNRETC